MFGCAAATCNCRGLGRVARLGEILSKISSWSPKGPQRSLSTSRFEFKALKFARDSERPGAVRSNPAGSRCHFNSSKKFIPEPRDAAQEQSPEADVGVFVVWILPRPGVGLGMTRSRRAAGLGFNGKADVHYEPTSRGAQASESLHFHSDRGLGTFEVPSPRT